MNRTKVPDAPAGLDESRVVICGSMSSLHYMDRISEELQAEGVRALCPASDDDYRSELSAVEVRRLKKEASARHMNWIKARGTKAVLVVNVDKNGQQNYVGPNSFAEIAVAFSEGRDIFLFHGMPRNYEDELRAWGARCLYGNLTSLIEEMNPPRQTGRRRDPQAWGPLLFVESQA